MKKKECSCGVEIKNNRKDDTCCGPANPGPRIFRRPNIAGYMDTPAGRVTRVSRKWTISDRFGALGTRFMVSRMDYAIRPGLYAVGDPKPSSPVMVSANYKLSFDILRTSIKDLDAWILVLDTKGINVWCAAGKGSFGTGELVNRLKITRLAKVIRHRNLILPQLSATGVSAHLVRRLSGFNVIYGPVRANDIPEFMNRGSIADQKMRTVNFPIADRIAVSWTEFTPGFLLSLAISAGWGLLYYLTASGFSLINGLHQALFMLMILLLGVTSGSLLTAVLLPFLPGKRFFTKGALLGIVISACAITLEKILFQTPVTILGILSITALITGISGYIAYNYTGCTTFTSASGVRREARIALPASIVLVALGTILMVIRTFIVH